MKRPLAVALILSAPLAVFAQRGGGGHSAPVHSAPAVHSAPQVSRGAFPTAAPAQHYAPSVQHYSAPVQQHYSAPVQHYSAPAPTVVHHSYSQPALVSNAVYARPSYGYGGYSSPYIGVSFGLPGFSASIYSTGSGYYRGYSGYGYPNYGYGGFGYGYGGTVYGLTPNFGYGYGISSGFGSPYYLNNFAYQPSYGPTVPASIVAPAIYVQGTGPSATSLMTLVSPNSTQLPAPTTTSNQATQLDYFGQGKALLNEGKYAEAIKSLRHAIVDDPQNPNLAATATVALSMNKNFEEAAGAAQQTLSLIAPEKWATELPASLKGLNTTLAVAALRKQIADKPNDAGYQFLAGYLSFANGEFKRSATDFEGVLKLVPNDPLATKLRDTASKAAEGK